MKIKRFGIIFEIVMVIFWGLLITLINKVFDKPIVESAFIVLGVVSIVYFLVYGSVWGFRKLMCRYKHENKYKNRLV